MIPLPIWTPTNLEYHALRTSWSPSMMKQFRQSPAMAYRRFVDGIEDQLGRSQALVTGSAVNAILLDAGHVRVVEVQSAAAKKFRDEQRLYPLDILVTRPEYENVMGICDAIQNPQTQYATLARALLNDGEGHAEWAHRWVDAQTQIPCKCMIDRLTMVGGVPAVVELKTSRDPAPQEFSKQAWNLGYHAQAAHNVAGVSDAIADAGEIMFFMVVVRNCPPYEVAVYEGSHNFLSKGRELRSETLVKIARQIQLGGRWRAEWEMFEGEDIQQIEPPVWAK